MRLTKWLNKLAGTALILFPPALMAQSLTLDQVQLEARTNYPLIRQKDLIKQTSALTLDNLNKGYLPQLSFNAQATYQSDVTRVEIPVPGITVNLLSRDLYKATADVSQLLFDGGAIKNQKELQKLNAETEDQRVEVELHQIRERINQLFLGVLLLDQQIKQTDLVKADIQTGIRKTEALLKNGLTFRSNLSSLEAEFLKADQRAIELRSSRKGMIKALALFTGKDLDENTRLEMPGVPAISKEISRPELMLFKKQTDVVKQQQKLLVAKNLPKASLFGQGGYGRPGLNMLQDQFDWFYIAGARINWPVSSLYTFKKEKRIINLHSKSIAAQQDAFILSTHAQLTQQESEIQKLQALIESDKQIIALREKVTMAAKAQLENQAISTSDYIREVNAEDQARQSLITHQVQLLQAQLNYNTIAGF